MTPQEAARAAQLAVFSAKTLEAKTQNFTDLKWANQMYSYVRVMQGLKPQEPPENASDMALVKAALTKTNRRGEPILSIPELMARARKNAERWEPLLVKMVGIAGRIEDYAETSKSIVDDMVKKSETQLKKSEIAKLTPEAFLPIKENFNKRLNRLLLKANEFKGEAEGIRAELISYQNDIIRDHDESVDVKAKYQEWLDKEDVEVKAWLQAAGIKEGKNDIATLIKRLQDDVADYTAKHAGLTSGAVGAAGGAVGFGLVVFPPFGAIAGVIASITMGALAAEMQKMKEMFAGRLDRTQKFNTVKLFFDVQRKTLDDMIQACQTAVLALGDVSSFWSEIGQSIDRLRGSSGALNQLPGEPDNPWVEAIDVYASSDANKVYDQIIKRCEVFTKLAFVKDLKAMEIAA